MPPVDWPQLAIGLLLCLMGWMVYWVGLHLTGAMVGAAAGVVVAYAVGILVKLTPESLYWVLPLGGVVGFFVGLLLIRGLHRFFFFLSGAAIGLAVGQQTYEWAFENTTWAELHPVTWQMVFDITGSLLGGLILLRASKWVVAALTSAGGALLAALAVEDALALYGVIPLAVASFFWQVGLLRTFDGNRRVEYDEEED